MAKNMFRPKTQKTVIFTCMALIGRLQFYPGLMAMVHGLVQNGLLVELFGQAPLTHLYIQSLK